MKNYLSQILINRDLKKRILFTLFALFVYRTVAQIPLSAVDKTQLENFFSSNQLLGLLNIFSGGALSNFSIGFMGVAPYITSSIIFQLLSYVIPSLESLQKEGEQGRQIINQYTRMLTVPLGFIQSFSLIALLKNQGVIPNLSGLDLVSILIITTASTVFLMWIGELITEQGIGNGISLIITAGIIAGIPIQISNTISAAFGGGIVDSSKIIETISFLGIALLTVVVIVIFNDAVRKIPISYARRVIGRRSFGGVDSHLPMKINSAGVIPIIFALSIIVFPGLISGFIANNAKSAVLAGFFKNVANIFNPQSIYYGIMYFILVIAFTYFYTSIVFKPKDVAENLQKQGGFIPGVRPGSETINFLSKISLRLTLPGSIFLGVIAILPFILQLIFKNSNFIIGGTGILIIVSVVLETASQIKANLINDQYENYSI